ncbi:MAG: TonB-dependent receptor domain-containing protein [Chitinophagales bacterium]
MNKLILILLLFISLASNAQVVIKGKVIDIATQQPIEFANVTLSGSSLDYPIGTMTNLDGSFELSTKEGLFTLQVFYVGAEPFSKEIEITNQDIDLGVISIKNLHELNEIVVVAERKLIQRKIDRLVFNVENSSKASEGDALEVLKVMPSVRVQNDQISMIGKSSLSVMINGKIVNLPQDEVANFLKSIASEDIKNIEVIATPPAKYEADGNSGMVNIILKQAKRNAWNAQIKASSRQRKYNTASFGGNFSYNKNSFSLVTSINHSDGRYYQEQDDYAYFEDGLWYTSSPFGGDIRRTNARLDISYKISDSWDIGAQYIYNTRNFVIDDDKPYTPVLDYDTDETIRYLQSDNFTEFTPQIHSINLNNTVVLDSLGRNITVNLDYFTYNNPDLKTYKGISVINEPFSEQFYSGINDNKQDVENYSAKIDVELPYEWAKLSFGGKLSVSKSINDNSFFNSGLIDAEVTDFELNNRDFNYDENINSLYASVNKAFNDKWSMQLGLRMEATNTNSNSEVLGIDLDNDYVKLFPTLFLSYKVTENSSLAFNYSKRIQRPNFFDLNPNIFFINPFQTIEGNAFLQPAFIDNLELTHTYKNLVSKIYYSYEDNLFGQVSLADKATNIVNFTNRNYINTHRFGLSQNYTIKPTSWWTSSNSFDMNYSVSVFDLEGNNEKQKGLNGRLSTSNDVKLNEGKTFLLGVNYWYNLPGIDGIFETKSASNFALSLQYFMLDKDLNITLRANDIFKDSAQRLEATVNDIRQTARYYYDSQSIQLSVSYKFGNKNIKAKKHKSGNTEERGRTGN